MVFRSIIGPEFINELTPLFGDKAPSYSTVKNWFNLFNCGRRSLKGEVRKGPTRTAVVSENIDAVREVIMKHRHVTYHQKEAT